MITLREVQSSDLDRFFEFQQDADAAHMAGFASTNPSDRSIFDHHWHELLSSDDTIVRTIDFDGEPVGSIAAFEDEDSREIMFWTDKRFWGRGLTRSAVTRFLEDFPERPVSARVVVDNGGTLSILQALGFREIGRESSFSNVRAEVVEEILLQLD
ncbi:GNAT family N-acetyltransferase [Nesterenkonia halobia]|uniref:N-acetyltransferase domain-containing protein n=1 Tax=Nesterenkonia halobia TaxID=37922 RepID=A0ABP6RC61_9MICC